MKRRFTLNATSQKTAFFNFSFDSVILRNINFTWTSHIIYICFLSEIFTWYNVFNSVMDLRYLSIAWTIKFSLSVVLHVKRDLI
jgi:hypothetical protein